MSDMGQRAAYFLGHEWIATISAASLMWEIAKHGEDLSPVVRVPFESTIAAIEDTAPLLSQDGDIEPTLERVRSAFHAFRTRWCDDDHQSSMDHRDESDAEFQHQLMRPDNVLHCCGFFTAFDSIYSLRCHLPDSSLPWFRLGLAVATTRAGDEIVELLELTESCPRSVSYLIGLVNEVSTNSLLFADLQISDIPSDKFIDKTTRVAIEIDRMVRETIVPTFEGAYRRTCRLQQQEVAVLIGRDVRTVRQMIDDGILPARGIPGSNRLEFPLDIIKLHKAVHDTRKATEQASHSQRQESSDQRQS